jgi:hypothetical protein
MVPPEPILANQIYHASTELHNRKSKSAASLQGTAQHQLFLTYQQT